MPVPSPPATIGVLASGGVDSCVLVGHLLRQGHCVFPFYVRCGLAWERAELAALRAFLRAVATSQLEELQVFDLPLVDLYGDHWSIAGHGVPDAGSPDGAVYLPGRNALLCIKPVLWCGMHGIGRLALATLAGNPFADATNDFFHRFEATLAQATGKRVSVQHPFGGAAEGRRAAARTRAPLGTDVFLHRARRRHPLRSLQQMRRTPSGLRRSGR